MDSQYLYKIKEEIDQRAASKNCSLKDFYENKSTWEISSPKKLERTLGISDISHDYKFPDNMEAQEFYDCLKPLQIMALAEKNSYALLNASKVPQAVHEDIFFEWYDTYMPAAKKIYKTILDLNPELKPFFKQSEQSPYQSLESLVLTTTSAYPVECAEYFATSANKDALNSEKAYTNRIIKERTGGAFEGAFNSWCVSPKTFEKIMRKMDEKAYKAVSLAKQTPQKPSSTKSFEQNSFMQFQESRGYFDD